MLSREAKSGWYFEFLSTAPSFERTYTPAAFHACGFEKKSKRGRQVRVYEKKIGV